MEELETLKNKIQKLLAKAESSKKIGNIEESALFAQKVNELLLKHNLDIAEINTDAESDLSEDGEALTTSKSNGKWTCRLLDTLLKYNFCTCVYHDRGEKEMRTTIIGSKENIIAVVYLYEILKKQFENLAKSEYSKYLDDCRNKLIILDSQYQRPLTYFNGKLIANTEFKKVKDGYVLRKPQKYVKNVANRSKYYKSFLLGAVTGVFRKLKESQDLLKSNTDDISIKLTSLVLSNQSKLQDYIDNHFNISGSNRRRKSTVMGDVYKAGIEAGRNSSFAKGVSVGDSVATKSIN